MTTDILKNYAKDGEHNVGSISSIQVKTLANGARVDDSVTTGIDNWTLVELAGFNTEGERLCKPLSAGTVEIAYLVATPEQRFLGEDIAHFYNDVGEFARLVVLEPTYTRFECSNYNATGVDDTAAVGQIAYFDTTTKKFVLLANTATSDDDYTAAKYKFEVVADESDTAGNFLVPTIRLMSTKVGY